MARKYWAMDRTGFIRRIESQALLGGERRRTELALFTKRFTGCSEVVKQLLLDHSVLTGGMERTHLDHQKTHIEYSRAKDCGVTVCCQACDLRCILWILKTKQKTLGKHAPADV